MAEPTPHNSVARAMRNGGFGSVTPGEAPTLQALWAAIGHTRGLVEALAPGMGFLVTYTLTQELVLSVAAPIALAVIFIAARALQKTAMMPAIAGLVGIAASAGVALWSGRPEDNFVLGFAVNALWVVVLSVSLVVGRPLVGFLAGALAGDPQWRSRPGTRRIGAVATALWLVVFGLRLIVQVPLYLAGSVSALAAAKLIMGVPLYAALLWVTWLLYRAVYGTNRATAE